MRPNENNHHTRRRLKKLRKHKPRRPDGSQAKTLPQVGALGWQNISNTNAAMGMKGEARGGARYT